MLYPKKAIHYCVVELLTTHSSQPMTPKIYLDNAATTVVAPEVVEAMLPYLTQAYGNASSVHSFGQQARAAIERARRQVAMLIGAAESSEIIFVSGGTEANNLAIQGIAKSYGRPGQHIITTAFEHPAVLGPCAALENRGFRVTRLPVYENGLIRFEDVRAALTDDTILMTVMMANNEVGTLQPVAEIGKLVHEVREHRPHLYFHVDAVQAAGKVPINVNELGVDLLSLSGHKIHAPKGVGALYLRKGVRLAAQQLGGHHERDRRAGTENVAGIVAFGKAAELAGQPISAMAEIARLRDHLEQSLIEKIPGLQVNGDPNSRLPNLTNLSFDTIDAESLLIALDLKGIAVSTGAACSSGSTEPSHVLTAMGFSRERVRSSLRLSLSRFTTPAEIDRVIEVLPELINRQRQKARGA